MPGMSRAFAVFLGLSAVVGCTQQSPTSPAPSTSPFVQVARVTLSLPEQPLVAGTTVSLRALARMSDGTDVAVFDGAQWVSENPDVARVDARGTLDALREGKTTVHVGVKGASASLTVTVVMNMTGVWSITYIPLSCSPSYTAAACREVGGPVQLIDSITLFQSGDRVSGEWLAPFDGRITSSGRLVLQGQKCYTSDYRSDYEFAIEGWEMERAPDTDSFSGRASWREYDLSSWGNCNGTRTTAHAGGWRIIDFRRH